YDSNDDSSSIYDDYFSIENIDYVEASPPGSGLVSLEEVKEDNLREKLLNINLFIAKIKSLNENFTPDCVLKFPSLFPIPVEDSDSFLEKSDTSLSYLNNSLPEFETFSDHTEETNSGSTTTHAAPKVLLLAWDRVSEIKNAFGNKQYKLEDVQELFRKLLNDVQNIHEELDEYINIPSWNHHAFSNYDDDDDDEDYTIAITLEEPDNSLKPRVHVPNVLTTHPTLMLDSDFIPFDNSLPEFEIFYFDIEEKNSGSTTIHANISLSDLECFNFKREPDPSELTTIVDFGIRENILSETNVNLLPEEDHSPLFAYVEWIFLFFSCISLFLHIFSPLGMKIPFLTPTSPIIISLLYCWVYLIGVELSCLPKTLE
nr:hypothetical protein [Tanacetum cinerariifolium]